MHFFRLAFCLVFYFFTAIAFACEPCQFQTGADGKCQIPLPPNNDPLPCYDVNGNKRECTAEEAASNAAGQAANAASWQQIYGSMVAHDMAVNQCLDCKLPNTMVNRICTQPPKCYVGNTEVPANPDGSCPDKCPGGGMPDSVTRLCNPEHPCPDGSMSVNGYCPNDCNSALQANGLCGDSCGPGQTMNFVSDGSTCCVEISAPVAVCASSGSGSGSAGSGSGSNTSGSGSNGSGSGSGSSGSGSGSSGDGSGGGSCTGGQVLNSSGSCSCPTGQIMDSVTNTCQGNSSSGGSGSGSGSNASGAGSKGTGSGSGTDMTATNNKLDGINATLNKILGAGSGKGTATITYKAVHYDYGKYDDTQDKKLEAVRAELDTKWKDIKSQLSMLGVNVSGVGGLPRFEIGNIRGQYLVVDFNNWANALQPLSNAFYLIFVLAAAFILLGA